MLDRVDISSAEIIELEREVGLIRAMVAGIKGQHERKLWRKHLRRLEAQLGNLKRKQGAKKAQSCA